MARPRATKPDEPAGNLAFLLSQVGAHAAAAFANRLATLNLTPPHAGILRVIDRSQGITQQGLAQRLGMFPSRLVLVLDELEQRGLIERRDRPGDRRSFALHLTRGGRAILERIGRIARDHQRAVCAALDASERRQLSELLTRIADEQKLTPGIHPGYRRLGAAPQS
jgi:DNA-binding MarR family transcriptional regulator